MCNEFFPGVFGALLLLCLCHCARINSPQSIKYPNESTASWNTTQALAQEKGARNSRCLWSMKKWLVGDSGIMSGNPDDVRFFLYPNPFDRTLAEEIKFGDVSKLEKLQPGVQLKIVIHGFTKNYVAKSIQDIKDAYLLRMAQTIRAGGAAVFNVILVDWEPLGKPKVGEDLEGLFYRLAVGNVPVVGRRVGEFVQFLIANRAVGSLRDVHVIGFSLGAHIAGTVGSTLKEFNAGQPPARVTGLDPAGPAFYEKLSFSSRHLRKTDGKFVDVIHTNMGALGTVEALGHADFYPNGGGPSQYQCEREYDQKKAQNPSSDGGLWDNKLLSVASCSHNRAPEFFAMSILNPQMMACKCNNYKTFRNMACRCNEMAAFGEFCDSRARGTFYLDI